MSKHRRCTQRKAIAPLQSDDELRDWTTIGLVVIVSSLLLWVPLVVAHWHF
jgi:hypothetical protein